LKKFKYAARGRRGPNPKELTENEWWALGQHYGLHTPLLDWTESPFVAAYFAYAERDIAHVEPRALFGLSRGVVELVSKQIAEKYRGSKRPPVLEFLEPLSDDNQRLVSQGALFTRGPAGVDVESWVQEHCQMKGRRSITLTKWLLPSRDRYEAMQMLNQMNINALSLFPDLQGACLHCNRDVEGPPE
jgi:hypothetical protein